LTGVTYSELVNDYNQLYTQFLTWYNLFFGPNGLVNTQAFTVQDGSTTLNEFSVNATAFGVADVLAIETPTLATIVPEIGGIVDWIQVKFNSIVSQTGN